MSKAKTVFLIIALGLVAGIIFYLEAQKTAKNKSSNQDSKIQIQSMDKNEKSKIYEPAKEISSPNGFINTDPVTIQELIGKKIILVDFWTYSCINCQRTLPYLNAWHEKYKDQGLAILGIHTPEFEFEKNYQNVLAAVKKFNVQYPIILDNDFSTWQAYNNRYWPRKYLIDIDGFIVYDHIGEGAYQETENKIQELLTERAAILGTADQITRSTTNPANTESVDSQKPLSPEIYFGALRNAFLGNGTTGATGVQNFSPPAPEKENILYLAGKWNIQNEYAENQEPGTKILFSYRARKVNLVADADAPIKIKISQDGKFVRDLEILEAGLYRLIDDEVYGGHRLEIEIQQAGLKAFTFTFG